MFHLSFAAVPLFCTSVLPAWAYPKGRRSFSMGGLALAGLDVYINPEISLSHPSVFSICLHIDPTQVGLRSTAGRMCRVMVAMYHVYTQTHRRPNRHGGSIGDH
jgi:hypothetical protein